MFSLFVSLNKLGKTILIVTHEMDYVLEYCQECVVMKDGNVVFEGTPSSLFASDEILEKCELDCPSSFDFAKKLMKCLV